MEEAATPSGTETVDAVAMDEANQYLTFRLAEDTFAMNILKISEVMEYTHVMIVPRMPNFMRGVINLRGNIVPVVDMRVKFFMQEDLRTADTRIIAIEVASDAGKHIIGALVDSVWEVINLAPEHIEHASDICVSHSTGFISGIGRHNDRPVIVVDIDRIFSSQEIRIITSGASGKS
jgi:purine-binding chemotaxis protein CheW